MTEQSEAEKILRGELDKSQIQDLYIYNTETKTSRKVEGDFIVNANLRRILLAMEIYKNSNKL